MRPNPLPFEVTMHGILRLGTALLVLALSSACGGSSSPATRTVAISWNANREAGVNGAGGGYRVQIGTQAPIDVPYVSGASAPTSTTVQLGPGTYAITVVAYAALDAQGGNTGTTSAPSQSITLTVP